MRFIPRPSAMSAALVFLPVLALGQASAADGPTPEDKAIQFLAVEVPKWHEEQKCYSCHNNGDAVRALLMATQMGRLADRAPIADTLAFLSKPETWDKNGPDGPFKDEKLQR